MTRHRTSLVTTGAVLFLAFVLVLAACGGSDNGVDTSQQSTATTRTGVTTAPITGSGTTRATVAPDAPGVTLDVTFVRGEKVGTAHRRVAPTTAVGRAALEQLLGGPTAEEQAAGLATAIPAGTKLRSLDIADGTATVDLSAEFVSGGGSLSMRERLAQIVFTLTQFPSVKDVAIRIDGKPTTVFGGEGVMIDASVDRADFRDVTPLVFLESVAPGDTVSSPVTVAGESNTFEATVRIRVVGADGRVLADTFTTATSGTGTWGTFSEKVAFDKGSSSTGKVVVFWDSPKDGSPQDVVEVPVAFSK